MEFLQHILETMGRRPKAKRRFNLLREEVPARPAVNRGLPVLASFVLFTGIPLAGISRIQSDLDPSLNQPKVSSVAEIRDDIAALVGSLRQMSQIDWGPEKETAPATPEQPEVAQVSEPAMVSQEHQSLREPSKTEHQDQPQRVRMPGPVRTKEEIFYRKAQGYHRRQNLEMATGMYRRVLQENSGHRDALFHLSSIYMEQSQYAEAYPLLLDLVHRRPDDPRGLTNLAIAEIALGRPEKAIAHLDKALIQQDPPRFKIYFHQGVARGKLHRLEEALTWYRKSEDLDPGHAQLLFNMAVTFDRLERYDQALDCYVRFLRAGESSSAKERRDVEARIGVLVAYLAEEPKVPLSEGTH